MFISMLWKDPKHFVLTAIVVIFSICLHEFFHASCALRLGDSTAADHGHLSLNPLKQMGVMSLIMFLFLGFAWGAVPVNPNRLKAKYSWGPLAVSLAGPAANLLLALIGYAGFGLLTVFERYLSRAENPFLRNIVLILLLLGIYNLVMFVFNLIPAPGLDGWNALMEIYPRIRSVSSETMKGAMIFLIFASLMGVSWLFRGATWIMMTAEPIFAKLFGFL